MWTQGLTHLVDYAVGRGADRAALLARIGVDAATLADPERRLPVGTYYTGVEAVSETLRDPWLGLNYIDTIEPGALGAIGFLAAASRTVGEALARILRYHPTMTDGERFELEVVGDRACFRFTPWGPARPAHAHITEASARVAIRLHST